MKKFVSVFLIVLLVMLVWVAPVAAASGVQVDPPERSVWVDLLEKLLVAFVSFAAPLAVAWLFAQFKLVWAKFKAEKPDTAWLLEQAASMAVKAAEQANVAQHLDSKKDYALEVANKWLAAHGVPIDTFLLDAAIEAAVFDELNKNKPQPKPTGFVAE